MQITEITVLPTNDGVVRAYVDIVFDNCFKVEVIKVIQSPTGLFVSFPAKKQRDGSDRQSGISEPNPRQRVRLYSLRHLPFGVC